VKAKQAKECNCIEQVNDQLKPYNTRVVRELSLNFTTGKSRMLLLIPTEKIDSKKRGHAKTVVAAHCPVCGKRIRA
jgi:hypothetical protein